MNLTGVPDTNTGSVSVTGAIEFQDWHTMEIILKKLKTHTC